MSHDVTLIMHEQAFGDYLTDHSFLSLEVWAGEQARLILIQKFAFICDIVGHMRQIYRFFVNVDRESCYCAFLLRIKITQIVLLLLLVYSPTFSFMS